MCFSLFPKIKDNSHTNLFKKSFFFLSEFCLQVARNISRLLIIINYLMIQNSIIIVILPNRYKRFVKNLSSNF